MKVEKLSKNDEIILWAGLAYGQVEVLVEEVHIQDDGFVRITVEEIEWASLLVPIGTEVELA